MVEVGLLKTGSFDGRVKRLANAVLLVLDGLICMRVSGAPAVRIEDACDLLIGREG